MAAKGLHGNMCTAATTVLPQRNISAYQVVFLPVRVLIMSDRLPKSHHVLDLQSQPQNCSAGHHTASSCMGQGAGDCRLQGGGLEGRALMPSIFSLAGFCHEEPVALDVEAFDPPEGMVQWPGSASCKVMVVFCRSGSKLWKEGLKSCALSFTGVLHDRKPTVARKLREFLG